MLVCFVFVFCVEATASTSTSRTLDVGVRRDSRVWHISVGFGTVVRTGETRQEEREEKETTGRRKTDRHGEGKDEAERDETRRGS